MSTVNLFPHPFSLWKTPVEKDVENVEKYEFSTDIWPLGKFAGICGKLTAPGCVIPPSGARNPCYVNESFVKERAEK